MTSQRIPDGFTRSQVLRPRERSLRSSTLPIDASSPSPSLILNDTVIPDATPEKGAEQLANIPNQPTVDHAPVELIYHEFVVMEQPLSAAAVGPDAVSQAERSPSPMIEDLPPASASQAFGGEQIPDGTTGPETVDDRRSDRSSSLSEPPPADEDIKVDASDQHLATLVSSSQPPSASKNTFGRRTFGTRSSVAKKRGKK